MTTAHKITTALASLLFVLVVLVGYGLIKEHDNKIRAEAATTVAEGELQKNAQSELLNEEARDKEVQALQDVKQKTVTTTQIVHDVPQYITLPQPIHEVTPAEAAANSAIPDAPKAGDLVIPAISAKSFFDAQVDCKIATTTLSSCQQTTANLTSDKQIQATEIKALQTQIKGGTKWQRTLTAAKWIGIGAGAGIVTGYVLHK